MGGEDEGGLQRSWPVISPLALSFFFFFYNIFFK